MAVDSRDVQFVARPNGSYYVVLTVVFSYGGLTRTSVLKTTSGSLLGARDFFNSEYAALVAEADEVAVSSGLKGLRDAFNAASDAIIMGT